MVGELFDKGTIYAGEGDQQRSTELSAYSTQLMHLLTIIFCRGIPSGKLAWVGMLVGQDCRQNWLPKMERQRQDSAEQV